eukprot:39030-Prymnesium_polylepis.1
MPWTRRMTPGASSGPTALARARSSWKAQIERPASEAAAASSGKTQRCVGAGSGGGGGGGGGGVSAGCEGAPPISSHPLKLLKST